MASLVSQVGEMSPIKTHLCYTDFLMHEEREEDLPPLCAPSLGSLVISELLHLPLGAP